MRRILAAFLLTLALFVHTFAVVPVYRTTVDAYAQGNSTVSVWVNTDSGVYHCPGTRWYGKTKEGRYMQQKAAQAAGYRPAYGSVCG